MTQPVDTRGRGVTDLRLSVTDRCNLRCTYCMPRELFGANHVFLPRDEILSYEEFARLVTIFAGLGVSKVRLTGGEPLLRRDLETLVTAIAATPRRLRHRDDDERRAPRRARAEALRAAGLQPGDGEPRQRRSRDLRSHGGHQDPPVAPFSTASPRRRTPASAPIKLNAVVKRGVNDDGIVDLARYARDGGHVLRFIEYMDVGSSNGWDVDATSSPRQRCSRGSMQSFPSGRCRRAVQARSPSGGHTRTARRDRHHQLGVGALLRRLHPGHGSPRPVSSTPACSQRTGTDLRACSRSGATDEELHAAITASGRHGTTTTPSSARTCSPSRSADAEMSYLGG